MKFCIVEYVSAEQKHEVEADTVEQAIAIFKDGDAKLVKTEVTESIAAEIMYEVDGKQIRDEISPYDS